ncbi:hypothetical protein DYB35_010100 [Aphanomyces astaci]|uniref:Peptidase A2 domain-containing protein n=1 Tax=Aphanomyces astaci TaxID=112090 RepID=A0A3R7E200_APHAT|nr:hypothetical protein DYB35_010100 [Aphanomyces astaci]
MPPKISSCNILMRCQRQLDAAMVSALRAELGLSRARAGDDKALEQSRYDSELVQTRAAFEAEKREMLLESERNDEKWRTEFLRFKNEVLDASLAIREQARLDGDELRASLAQKDKTITLLERADAEKQTAALEVCPRCEELKLEVLKLTTRVVSQIEEERRLNAVADTRDLQIRILEGEAHESNVNLNMLTDMNGELQSELLSQEELRSERNVLEGTAAELVTKVADERALFDEERRSWLTQLSNDRSQADLERREMNIAMQAERSQLLSERLELLRVPATPNQPNVVSAVGYETAHPVQQPDYLHDSTVQVRRASSGGSSVSSTVMGSDFTIDRTPVLGMHPSKGSVTDKLDAIFDTLKTMQTPFLPTSHTIPVYMAGTSTSVMEPALASTMGTHTPLRPEPYRSAPAPTSGRGDGGDGNDPRRFGEGAYGSGGLSGGGGPEGNGGDGGGDPAPYPRFGADPYSRRPEDRHSLVGNARKQSLKLESVDKLQLDHFLGHLDDLQIEFELTDIELIRIFQYRVAESKIRTVQDWRARRHREGSNRTWRSTKRAFYKEFVQKSMSAKMAEITQNSIRKVKETVREYAWRINDAAQDLELQHSHAVQIFIDGCKDLGLASCIRGSETRPGTIQECLDYLRFRDMDVDMRLNDANGHDVPRSTSSATRVNRTNSTDATSKSTEEAMAALRADVASMMQNQLASLTNVVANIAPRRPSGNQPVVPNIRMDPDETTTQSGRVVCGRCQRSGHGREACPHELDTEDKVAGSPVEEGYPHDGSMRTLGRVGYALEVEVGFPTEVLRGEPAVEQAPLESHDQYEKSVVDSVASSEARAVRVDLPVQGAASTAGGYTDLPYSTVVESQVTGPEKLTLPSVNDPSVRWVFTPHQIEAIVRCDFPGIVEGLHSDMEDRMLPLTKADVADQVRKIRDRRKSPTHREIAEVIMQAIQRKLTDEDMRLLETPADMDDPARWLRWFASALETCEEARRADRNFNDNRSALVATTRWARSFRKYCTSVWRLNGHCFAPRRALLELAAGHIVHPAEVTPLRPRELARTPRLPAGSVAADSGQLIGEAEVIHSNPFCDTEPVYEPSPEDEVARSHRNAWRNDSTYQRDLYTVTSVARAHPSRLICHLSNDNAVPLTVVSVNGAKMSALIDTGASVSLLSERCWLSLGASALWSRKSGLVSVENRSLATLGLRRFAIGIAGRTEVFPCWVMPDTVVDCVLGIDFLRRCKAVIDLETNELRIPHTSYVIKLTPIDEHPKSQATMAMATSDSPFLPDLTTLALTSPLRIRPRQRRMVMCSFSTPIPCGTHVLSESLPGFQIHMARSLGVASSNMIWVQVQNPSEGTIRIGCGTLVGLVATLPHGYADAGAPKPPEPPPDRDLPTQDSPQSSDSVEEGRTVWTQQAHPNVICPVLMKTPASTAVLKEIPIN